MENSTLRKLRRHGENEEPLSARGPSLAPSVSVASAQMSLLLAQLLAKLQLGFGATFGDQAAAGSALTCFAALAALASRKENASCLTASVCQHHRGNVIASVTTSEINPRRSRFPATRPCAEPDNAESHTAKDANQYALVAAGPRLTQHSDPYISEDP